MSPAALMRLVSRRGTVASARFVAGKRVSAVSPLSTLARVSAPSMRTSWALQASRAFSGSAARFGSGTTDIHLSQALADELKYEQENADATRGNPDWLNTFLEQGVWSIEDVRGNDEVSFTRKFGDENIRLMFSIADIAVEDEFSELEGEEAEEAEPSPPIRASVAITKSNGPGALNIDMICQDNTFVVENISFYDDATLGTELTAEADWKRRGLYLGPPFDTLDPNVQDVVVNYLSERGINESLATIIPDYASWKEQQEYVKWLGKVKTFVDL